MTNTAEQHIIDAITEQLAPYEGKDITVTGPGGSRSEKLIAVRPGHGVTAEYNSRIRAVNGDDLIWAYSGFSVEEAE